MQCPVGAIVVKVCHVLDQRCLEVAAVDDLHSVEYLAADGADLSLGDRVRPRRPHRYPQKSDAFADEYGIENTGELAVAISDQNLEQW